MKELVNIQTQLNAPKNQFNKFGGYKYRSCEDILANVKDLLKENKCTLTLTDDIVMVSDRIYVKATVTLKNEAGEIESTTAYAREDDGKKGMDGSQITGAASSYARKYALNGLFAIDDTKDADATNTHGKENKKQEQQQPQVNEAEMLAEAIDKAETIQNRLLFEAWQRKYAAIKDNAQFVALAKKISEKYPKPSRK